VPWELENLRGEEGVKQVYKIQIEVLLKPDDAAIDAVQELDDVQDGEALIQVFYSPRSANGSTTQSTSRVLICIRLHGKYKAAACAVAMVLQIDRDFPALAELVDVRVELCTW
jgi:hypothetical protein